MHRYVDPGLLISRCSQCRRLAKKTAASYSDEDDEDEDSGGGGGDSGQPRGQLCELHAFLVEQMEARQSCHPVESQERAITCREVSQRLAMYPYPSAVPSAAALVH